MARTDRVREIAAKLEMWEREHARTVRDGVVTLPGRLFYIADHLVELEDTRAQLAIDATLDEALNSGDGSYRP